MNTPDTLEALARDIRRLGWLTERLQDGSLTPYDVAARDALAVDLRQRLGAYAAQRAQERAAGADPA